MDKEQIKVIIDSGLESILVNISRNENIKINNIPSLQLSKWDETVNNITDLFIELLNQNK